MKSRPIIATSKDPAVPPQDLDGITTDAAWQAWGVRDPYYAVLTRPKYRSGVITPEAMRDFFDSGKTNVDRVFDLCRRYIDSDFSPQRVLDFGCGVGRMIIPFAAGASEVVGMDIAESMLAQARLNCDERGCHNVTLVRSDDTLSAAIGEFDLVHSCMVLQHVDIARGRTLFAELVRKIRPGGCGVIQLPYAWDIYATTFGVAPVAPPVKPPPHGLFSRMKSIGRRATERLAKLRKPAAIEPQPDAKPPDPEMQMNYYNLSEIMFILQGSGVERVHSEFVNHGGALGVLMVFKKTRNDC